MKPQAQREWGTRVSLDFFLGGAGAGLIGSYLLAARLAGLPALHFGVLAAGAILVIAGAALLASELGRPANAARSFLKAGSSWMARGAILNLLLIVLLVLLLAAERSGAAGLAQPLAVLAIIAAVLVAGYPGLLLFSARDVRLWRSPWLPLLLFAYSAASGVGLLLMADGVLSLQLGFSVVKVELALIVVLAALFAAYWAGVSATKTAGVAQGLRQLWRGELRGAFVFGCLGVGLLLPLFCFIDLTFVAGHWAALPLTTGTLGLLIGAYLTRYCLLRAACHEPLGFLENSGR